MNILDYIKPDKFPNNYILKRYTKTARSQPTFDTRDYNTTTSDGSSRLSKQDILPQLNLMVNKKAMRCDQQYDRAYYVLKRLVTPTMRLYLPCVGARLRGMMTHK